MDNDFKILHPVREVSISPERTITVREMRWKDAVAFAEKLSGVIGQFTSTEGRLVVTAERIASAVTSSGTLATDLVSRSCGLSPDEVGDLAPSQVLDLLAAALEVNLPAWFAFFQESRAPTGIESSTRISTGGSFFSFLAAKSIPCDFRLKRVAGFRFATSSIFLPASASGL